MYDWLHYFPVCTKNWPPEPNKKILGIPVSLWSKMKVESTNFKQGKCCF